MERRTKIALAIGGLAAAGLLFSRRKNLYLALDTAKREAFRLAVNSAARPYVDAIWNASDATGISPLIIYGLGLRESGWGATLKPVGPGGTGDFTPRDPKAWGSALPPVKGRDGQQAGWGFGLLQLDWHSYKDWLASNAWWDPAVMILKGSQVLKERLTFFASTKQYKFSSTSTLTDGKLVNFVPSSAKARYGVSVDYVKDPRPLSGLPLIRAGLASYNGGIANVLRAVAAGKDPDFTTTGADYSQWIVSRITPLYNKIMG